MILSLAIAFCLTGEVFLSQQFQHSFLLHFPYGGGYHESHQCRFVHLPVYISAYNMCVCMPAAELYSIHAGKFETT